MNAADAYKPVARRRLLTLRLPPLTTLLLYLCTAPPLAHAAPPLRAVIELHAQVADTTVDDGLRLEFDLALCAKQRCVREEQIHIAQTLRSTSVLIRRGQVVTRHLIGVSRQVPRTIARDHVLVIRRTGVFPVDASTLHPSDSEMVPWAQLAPNLSPGRIEIKLEGSVYSIDDHAYWFSTPWISVTIHAASEQFLTLQQLQDAVHYKSAELIRSRGESVEAVEACRRGANITFAGGDQAGNRLFQVFGGPVEAYGQVVYTLVSNAAGELLDMRKERRITCVAEGTPLITSRGRVPIEQVVLGDLVASSSLESGQQTWARVKQRQVHTGDALLIINQRWRLTAEHPVAVNGQWKPAGDLQTGDHLHTTDGFALVNEVERVSGAARVYDLEVDEPHAFFADGLLVHNKSLIRPTGFFYRADLLTDRALAKALLALTREVAACAVSSGLKRSAEVLVTLSEEAGGLPVKVRNAGVHSDYQLRSCLHALLDPLRQRRPFPSRLAILTVSNGRGKVHWPSSSPPVPSVGRQKAAASGKRQVGGALGSCDPNDPLCGL